MADRQSFRRSDLVDEVEAPTPVPRPASRPPRASSAATPSIMTPSIMTKVKLRRPKNLRRVLLMLGPAIVLAAGLFAYMTGGRYVSTDNAYVHAGKLTVATDVSGIVSNVAVRESQRVEKGDVLFTLDQEPFRIALAGAEANLGTVRNQITTQQATYRQKNTL